GGDGHHELVADGLVVVLRTLAVIVHVLAVAVGDAHLGNHVEAHTRFGAHVHFGGGHHHDEGEQLGRRVVGDGEHQGEGLACVARPYVAAHPRGHEGLLLHGDNLHAADEAFAVYHDGALV